MKKFLILFVMLLATTVTFAQESKVFTYEYVLVTENSVPEKEWRRMDTSVTIDKTTFKVVIGNKTFNFVRASEVFEGFTEGGYKYWACDLRIILDGEVLDSGTADDIVRLQIFEDSRYGFRLFFGKGNSIQFSN